jgi:hypothetical protein
MGRSPVTMPNELHEEAVAGAGAEPPPRPEPLPAAPAVSESSARREIVGLGLLFVGALAVCVLAYLAFAVPGPWLPSSNPLAWGARDLHLARGAGRLVRDELFVTAPDATGMTIISVATDIRAIDYAAIAWIAIDVPENAQARLLWQTYYAPDKINAVPLRIESGRLLPVLLVKEPQWIGRVKGIALAISGNLPQPIIVRGVQAKPMGVGEVLSDRAHEWLAFESWTGTSINTVTGGADYQELPLPLLLAAAIALATLALALVRHFRPVWLSARVGMALIAFFVGAWLLLDMRWTWNLLRQAQSTSERYSGKSWEEKRLNSDDGALFAFVQKALKVLPGKPARIFVVADEHYFRGRAAYHLYPHNVFFDPRNNLMPAADQLRPDDWLLVYQRRGVQYDAAQQRLRWDPAQSVAAEVKLVGEGAALFEIR